MPLIDPVDAYNGLSRRMQAIVVAGDVDAVSTEALAAARAAVSRLSVEQLRDLADMHILFRDDAPADVMVDFWLRKRLAAELLKTTDAGSKPYPTQPETLEIGRAGQPPALGTYQPLPPYRVRKTRRPKAPAKPPTTSSKLP